MNPWALRDIIPYGLAIGVVAVFLYLCYLYATARALQRKRDELKKNVIGK